MSDEADWLWGDVLEYVGPPDPWRDMILARGSLYRVREVHRGQAVRVRLEGVPWLLAAKLFCRVACRRVR